MSNPLAAKICNLNLLLDNGDILKLQSAQLPLIIGLLRKYFNRTLFNGKIIDTAELQKALNSKVRDQGEFQGLWFGPDFRIYELLACTAAQCSMNEFRAQDMHSFLFWEACAQPDLVRELTNSRSGSIDGCLIFIKDGEKGGYPLPIEIKSTMINPSKPPHSNMTGQVLSIIERKKVEFGRQNQLSILFILPQPTGSSSVALNFHSIVESFRQILGLNSIGMLVIPLFKEDGVILQTYIILGQYFEFSKEHISQFMRCYKYRI